MVVVPLTVRLPDSVSAAPTIFPTVILGVPDNPVAVPVRAPVKLVAVITPVTFTPPAPVIA
jgi:hypothetical protein